MLSPTAACCSESFTDVPADHWAADSVITLAEAGVLSGYPDGTYRGDRPVTRYELAVALQAMIEFIRKSREPIQTDLPPPTTSGHWAERSMEFLQAGGYLPRQSFLFERPVSTVTVSQLGEALAWVAGRLIQIQVPSRSGEAILVDDSDPVLSRLSGIDNPAAHRSEPGAWSASR